MIWTKEDDEFLRGFRNNLDDDNTKLKEEIKQRLIHNRYIVHVLDNKELEANDAEPDDYFGVNILPYYLISPTQTSSGNFVCFDTSAEPRSRWENTNTEKYQRIIFYILCEKKNAIEPTTSLARHDLLAALIKHEFNFTALSCGRIRCISDVSGVTDNDYNSRTLTFQAKTDNNLVKTKDGIPRIINHSTVT